MQQPGVFDHGRQPHEVICEEKYKSNMNLYYTNMIEVFKLIKYIEIRA